MALFISHDSGLLNGVNYGHGSGINVELMTQVLFAWNVVTYLLCVGGTRPFVIARLCTRRVSYPDNVQSPYGARLDIGCTIAWYGLINRPRQPTLYRIAANACVCRRIGIPCRHA